MAKQKTYHHKVMQNTSDDDNNSNQKNAATLYLSESTKKSQVFSIGRYLLENAEFTYIIVECFPAKNVDKNNIQFCRVLIKKVYNF